jgi:hypothetical protein
LTHLQNSYIFMLEVSVSCSFPQLVDQQIKVRVLLL